MKSIDKRTYPAIFHYSQENEYCLSVSFPDFPGCVTKGRTTEEAIEMAQETLALHLHGLEENIDLPQSSGFVKTGENEALVLVTVNMGSFKEVMENQEVEKTLTIPARLSIAAENAGVDFSQLLQTALKEHLGIKCGRDVSA
jgi:predicted RNase H-like HicB family nuclease